MARLSSVRVPKDAGPVMRRLAELSADEFQALRSGLNSPLTRDADLESAVSQSVPQWSESEVEDFVGHMVSLSALAASHRFDPAALAETVVDLLPADFTTNLPDGFDERLGAVLASSGLGGFAKALDVSREFERLIHLTRTMTDIRPVFGADPNVEPLGSVIVHTLRVDYFANGQVETVSYAMTAKDLRDMIEVLQRAESKAAVLSQSLADAGWTEYQIEGDPDE